MRLGNTRCKASLVMFFALAFAWSWACWLLAAALNGEYPFAADALSLTGGFGPSLAAMVVVAHRQRSGWSAPLDGAVPGRARRLALDPAGVRLSRILHGAGGRRPRGIGWHLAASTRRSSCVDGGTELLTHLLCVRPVRRGVRLARIRLVGHAVAVGRALQHFVAGAVWAVWHLPLFYSAGTVQSHLPMDLYALSAVASSVLFAWLFNRSQGSVVPVPVLHTAVDAWSLIFPVLVLPDGSNQRPFKSSSASWC